MILTTTFKQDDGETGYTSVTYDCCQMESMVSHDVRFAVFCLFNNDDDIGTVICIKGGTALTTTWDYAEHYWYSEWFRHIATTSNIFIEFAKAERSQEKMSCVFRQEIHSETYKNDILDAIDDWFFRGGNDEQ